MAFLNILPDPNNKIDNAGIADNTNGVAGPGFASMTLTSNDKVMMSRTNTGRVITRKTATQQWKLKISYNPLTRDEFEPVYNFLLYYGKLRPFYVKLPQHLTSRNSSIYNNGVIYGGNAAAGAQYVVAGFGSNAESDKPRPGDMFRVEDTSDSLHEKVYRVLRVETATAGTYEGSIPDTNTARIWTYPNILRPIAANQTLRFVDPQMRVILDRDVISYSLNTDNLYKFDLQLTEALA